MLVCNNVEIDVNCCFVLSVSVGSDISQACSHCGAAEAQFVVGLVYFFSVD